MKLNKSILGLVVLAIFIFSSCSQARYGNHTRRVKANNIVQKSTKAEKISNATTKIAADEVNEQIEKSSDEIIVEHKSTISEERTATSVELPSYEKQTKESTKTKKRGAKKVEKLMSNVKVATKVKQAKENIRSSVTQTDDEIGDILYIILIVLLVLLILNLITKLIPALSWLIGLAVLVLLIYLLLQII